MTFLFSAERTPIAALAVSFAFVLPSMSYAETVQVVVRTFIPKEHPTKEGYVLPVPNQTDKFMLPDAPVGACFGTDNRGFSKDKAASARFGGVITFDTDDITATISETTGTTTEYNCTTGDVICTKISGSGGVSGSAKQAGDVISFDYVGEASNPCLTVSPDIEFSGTVSLDLNQRTVSIDGKVDVFPSFEALFIKPDGSVEVLYQEDPANGATPADLVTSPSGGSRAVSRAGVSF